MRKRTCNCNRQWIQMSEREWENVFKRIEDDFGYKATHYSPGPLSMSQKAWIASQQGYESVVWAGNADEIAWK